MSSVIRDSADPTAPVASQVVRPSPKQTPAERLDVYRCAYASRLIEVLLADYDAVAFALGDERWDRLARDYVANHPSRGPSLNVFGRDLPAFVDAQPDLERRGFLVELARLQWTVQESFDAPEFTPLDATTLAHLGPDEWAQIVLRTNPSVRVLEFRHPTNRYLQAFFDGDEPTIPPAEPSWVLVNRKEGRVWRTSTNGAVGRLLGALIAGTAFGDAVQLAEDEGVDAGRWFREWSADGVFVAAEQP